MTAFAAASYTDRLRMAEAKAPTLVPLPETKPFWAAARRHELSLPYCRACSAYHFYPRILVAMDTRIYPEKFYREYRSIAPDNPSLLAPPDEVLMRKLSALRALRSFAPLLVTLPLLAGCAANTSATAAPAAAVTQSWRVPCRL